MAGVHEDFGEKIGGAKKDLWKDRGLYADDLEAIGLYLAREIVTRQGGYIKVVSEPGRGSEFSIMLPTK